ncbi:hypothetical protein AHF37_12057 [Paragonimus kellicotti]|nr:hypothetical protein AHF37_12057 [Paragonimus kellicotti]
MLRHGRMFICLLTLLHLLATDSNQVCPPGFRLVNQTICIIDMDSVNDFCSAGEKCASIVSTHGQRAFLIGRNYKLTLPQPVTQNSCTWSSINDGLAQVIRGLGGYRDGDPRTPNHEIPKESLKWLYDRPSRNSPFATFDDSGLLNETDKFTKRHCRVLCQWSSVQPKKKHTNKFASNFPISLPVMFTPTSQFDSCYSHVISTGLLECVYKCARKWECRSVYFNQQERVCLHMKYVDALIPRMYTTVQGSWIRFANTGIEH